MSSYKIHDFYSHKTEGVTINNNLNVTGTSQLETLNVSGNLDVVGNISLNGSNIVNSDGSMEVTGTAQLNALNVTGSVGIGTTNPSSKLDVVGDSLSMLNIKTTDPIAGPHILLKDFNDNESTISWIGDGSAGTGNVRDSALEIRTTGRINFTTTGSVSDPELTILNNGLVGIGTSSPLGTLHIVHPNEHPGFSITNYNQAHIVFERPLTSSTNRRWAMSVNSGNDLVFTYNYGAKGFLSDVGDVGQIDFTGQHRARFSEDNINKLNNISDYVGLIVCSTGNYINPVDINEALPYVELSTTSKDKRVFGVISNGEDTNDNLRKYQQGVFVSVMEIEENDHRVIINSVGEGGMWICDENGPIENGDYITTSNNAGYGMKQDDDLIHSYTVAKITCDEDFSDMTNGRILPNGVKCKFVGVTYHCG